MNLSTPDLLAYANILEQMTASNTELLTEISRAVSDGFCTKEDVETIFTRVDNCAQEADEALAKVQKELDLRMTKDLRMKNGIRKSQSNFQAFNEFVIKVNKKNAEAVAPLVEAAKNISQETIDKEVEQKLATMKVTKDDTDND